MQGAPVDRAREHTSHRNPIRSLYWRSKARSPHWASVAAVPPGHVVRPRCSPMRIGAREEFGCSRRIGSVQEDSAVRAVAAGGTRRFFTPRVPAALPSQGPRERRTGRMAPPGRTKELEKEEMEKNENRSSQRAPHTRVSDAGPMKVVPRTSGPASETLHNRRSGGTPH